MALPKNQTSLVEFNKGGYEAQWFAVVKNTEAGRKWIENLRKKNPHLKVWPRGRHSDRRLAYKTLGRNYDKSYPEHTIPLRVAERLAVYLYKKPTDKYCPLVHAWEDIYVRKYNVKI